MLLLELTFHLDNCGENEKLLSQFDMNTLLSSFKWVNCLFWCVFREGSLLVFRIQKVYVLVPKSLVLMRQDYYEKRRFLIRTCLKLIFFTAAYNFYSRILTLLTLNLTIYLNFCQTRIIYSCEVLLDTIF